MLADITLVIDAPLAGFILGKSGATLRNIQGESGVKIQLSQAAAGTPPTRTVRLTSGNAGGVKKAFDMCVAALHSAPKVATPKSGTTRVLVSHAVSAKLIGPKGEAVQRLKQISGAGIEVTTTTRDGSALVENTSAVKGGGGGGGGSSSSSSRLFKLTGTAAQVASAVHHIVDVTVSREQRRHEAFLSSWPFETSYDDHFETPLKAYADVLPVLRRLARRRRGGETSSRGKKRPRQEQQQAAVVDDCDSSAAALRRLRVYDPYYCTGGTRVALESLGCNPEAIVHAKRDFYADVAKAAVPPHDLLLTNPPYSADHKLKLLKYLQDGQQPPQPPQPPQPSPPPAPFLLLMPAWVVSTDYWQGFLRSLASIAQAGATTAHPSAAHPPAAVAVPSPAPSSGSPPPRDLERRAGVFYVSPCARYSFAHPEATGHSESPFHAVWFCGGFGADLGAAIASLKRLRRASTDEERVEVFRSGAMLQRRGHFVPGKQNVK